MSDTIKPGPKREYFRVKTPSILEVANVADYPAEVIRAVAQAANECGLEGRTLTGIALERNERSPEVSIVLEVETPTLPSIPQYANLTTSPLRPPFIREEETPTGGILGVAEAWARNACRQCGHPLELCNCVPVVHRNGQYRTALPHDPALLPPHRGFGSFQGAAFGVVEAWKRASKARDLSSPIDRAAHDMLVVRLNELANAALDEDHDGNHDDPL
ncbi:MAG TPA: hypothetical protein VHZ74_10640 [Bryobacteraceae bacterium]|nr:hypothetical protein [Bryobacteraceae bacterium]